MKRLLLIVFAFFLCVIAPVNAKTLHSANFEVGAPGTKAQGLDAFPADAGDSTRSNLHAFTGKQSAKLTVKGGSENTFKFGGLFPFKGEVKPGYTVCMAAKVLFPLGFDYTAKPRLKFMRIGRVFSAAGKAQGHVDFLILPPSYSQAFSYDPEMDNPYPIFFGKTKDKPKLGIWETYEGCVTYGRPGRVEFWKNGTSIFTNTTRNTISSQTDSIKYALLFTYWNGGAPKNQSFYVDDIVITVTPPSVAVQSAPAKVWTAGRKCQPTRYLIGAPDFVGGSTRRCIPVETVVGTCVKDSYGNKKWCKVLNTNPQEIVLSE